MTDRTVLVTGISGFIAKHVARELLQAGHGVRGTVRSMAREAEVRAALAPHCDTGRLSFAVADLQDDKGWDAAAEGCTDVMHVASPFPSAPPSHPDELVRPAVDGTLRVLRAAKRADVRRFVQTSSTVAVMHGYPRSRTAPFTEADWSHIERPHDMAYPMSKTLAERAARDFAEREGLHFASVNPGFVLGPALDADIGTSAGVIRSFMQGKYPGSPRVQFPVVDVRDVALAHRLAMERDLPTGGRYLAVGGVMWMAEMMRAVRTSLGDRARKVPTRELPDFLVKLVALFDRGARLTLPDLGRAVTVDNRRTQEALGMSFRPTDAAAVATAESLIALRLA